MKIKDKLYKFYQDNREKLESFYPGIRFSIYLNYFFSQNEFKGLCQETLLEENGDSYQSLIDDWMSKCERGVPFAYILKKAHFYGYDLEIEEGLFIPRFETEILVEMALDYLKERKTAKVYDVCTGPGTVAIPLLAQSHCHIELIGIDCEPKCIKFSLINAGLYSNNNINGGQKYSFQLGDRLYGQTEKADLIVCNPPYIKKIKDFEGVHPQTLMTEPDVALFLDDDIYEEWFDRLFSDIFSLLNEEGMALVEGHEDHLQGLKEMAIHLGFGQVEVVKDLTGRDRFLKMRKRIIEYGKTFY